MITLTRYYQLVSEKKLSESNVNLNGELEKCAGRTLEALRTLERKLQDINEARMRKLKFYSDQNKPSLQKKRKLNAMV